MARRPRGAGGLVPGSAAFTVLLGALAALPPLSIDLHLPALPALAAALSERPEAAAATLSAFAAGFGAAQLAYGPASDRHGRRPVLLLGLAVFTLAGVGCALAPTLPVLVACRAVQGAGAGAGMVLVRAVVRDLFPEPAAARLQFSRINMVMQVAPVVAPPLGASLLAAAGGAWRPLFAALALAGAALLAAVWRWLGESLPAPDRSALRPRRLLANYGRFVRLRACLGHALLAGALFGSLFAYVSGSALVFVGHLGLAPAAYAGVFAGVSACIVAGSWTLAALTRRGAGGRALGRAGIAGACAGSALALAALPTGAGGTATAAALVALALALAAAAFCFGLAMPLATQGALQPVPDMAGAASAALGCVQMLGGALSSLAVAALSGALGPAAMPLVMLGCALAAAVVHEAVLPRSSEAEERRAG